MTKPLMTPAEANARVLELNVLFNRVIELGMAHTTEHGQPAVIVDTNMCDDAAVLVCGRKVVEKLLALQQTARDARAEGETQKLITKLTT